MRQRGLHWSVISSESLWTICLVFSSMYAGWRRETRQSVSAFPLANIPPSGPSAVKVSIKRQPLRNNSAPLIASSDGIARPASNLSVVSSLTSGVFADQGHEAMTRPDRHHAADRQSGQQNSVDLPDFMLRLGRELHPRCIHQDRSQRGQQRRSGRCQERSCGRNRHSRSAAAATRARIGAGKLLLPETDRPFTTPWAAVPLHRVSGARWIRKMPFIMARALK
jgi:hypothetical protein